MKKIILGQKVKDKITRFEGTVISEHNYLYSTTTYGVTPVVDKDGNFKQTEYFEADRLDVIE